MLFGFAGFKLKLQAKLNGADEDTGAVTMILFLKEQFNRPLT